jgi:hypothetical protein
VRLEFAQWSSLVSPTPFWGLGIYLSLLGYPGYCSTSMLKVLQGKHQMDYCKYLHLPAHFFGPDMHKGIMTPSSGHAWSIESASLKSSSPQHPGCSKVLHRERSLRTQKDHIPATTSLARNDPDTMKDIKTRFLIISDTHAN